MRATLIVLALVVFGLFTLLSSPVVALVAIPAIILFSLLTTVAVHEISHALVGRALGLRVLLFKVAPILAIRRVRTWHLTRSGLLPAPGFVCFEPSRLPPADFLWATRWAILAGPVANLAVAGLIYVFKSDLEVSRVFGTPLSDGDLARNLLVTVLMAANLAAGVLSAIPAMAGGQSTDGRTFLVLRDPAHVRTYRAQQENIALAFGEVRPRDWFPATISRLSSLANVSRDDVDSVQLRLQSAALVALADMDKGNFDAARLVSEHALNLPVPAHVRLHPMYHGLQVIYVFSSVWMDEPVGAMKAQFQEIPPQDDPLYWATSALFAEADGEFAVAHAQCDLALRIANRVVAHSPIAVVEKDIVLSVRQRLTSPADDSLRSLLVAS